MLALILILLGVKVPDIILKPLHTIGNMATPMSLIYLGGLFALTSGGASSNATNSMLA